VAHALDVPSVVGVKALEIRDGMAIARRETPGGSEIFEVLLPAAISVREGINLPRYPSIPGRLRAKKASIERIRPQETGAQLEKVRLMLPSGRDKQVEVLGKGTEGVGPAVEILGRLGLVPT
jgi:electron transfer flavoprotein beta subunit